MPGEPERRELADLFDALLHVVLAEIAQSRLRRLAHRLDGNVLLTATNRTDWGGLPAARVADSMRCLTACKFKVLRT